MTTIERLLPVNTDLGYLTKHSNVTALPPRDEADQTRSIHYYVRLLKRQWWKIAIAVLSVTIIAAAAAFALTPQFQSTAQIAIDTKIPSTVVGESGAPNTSASEADEIFNTEIQLIQSDAVVRSVAKQFNLPIEMPPSGSKIDVDPSEAPITLSRLTVTRVPSSFLLNVSYRSKNPREAAAVANAVALSYIDRGRETRANSSTDDAVFMETQLAQMKKNMENSAQALVGYEQKLGLVNSDEKTSILSARLLQLNTEYTEAENDRIRKESAYQSLQNGSTAALEISSQAGDLSHLEATLREDEQKMAKLRAIYGANNAEYRQAANDLAEVTRQHAALKAAIAQRIETDYRQALNREKMLGATLKAARTTADAMGSNSAEYQQLKREAETNRTLYDQLSRKVKEASINGSFHSSTVRIANLARPAISPVFPNKPAIIAGGFCGALILSILAVLIGDMFDRSFRDADQAASIAGVDVVGTLPYVRDFKRLDNRSGTEKSLRLALPSASRYLNPPTNYVDSVATVLNAVVLATRERQLRSILVTSSIPGEGKSTCVMHMAKAFAHQGLRTLVIDADLRNPSQRQYFGLSVGQGMTDAIEKRLPLEAVVRNIAGFDHLHIVTASEAAGLVHRVGRQIQEILNEAADKYDMVFIDAPPVICFAETIQMACLVDGVLVVSEAGRTDQRAVQTALGTLRRIRAHTLGVVLSGVRAADSADYAYGYSNKAYASTADTA
jgi:succinoglycan biosynthesis transport protein ExoP